MTHWKRKSLLPSSLALVRLRCGVGTGLWPGRRASVAVGRDMGSGIRPGDRSTGRSWSKIVGFRFMAVTARGGGARQQGVSDCGASVRLSALAAGVGEDDGGFDDSGCPISGVSRHQGFGHSSFGAVLVEEGRCWVSVGGVCSTVAGVRERRRSDDLGYGKVVVVLQQLFWAGSSNWALFASSDCGPVLRLVVFGPGASSSS
ncbi:hypothetical protein RchiOBHm_Chr4g0389261 [Rosa chinensis]|uniref:Uncharacterized protein n=1 Tax=Rosa chinensis TaxID=74649 RepID=A0A2P6QPY5_ROSCH|nr:hypothetical protein RchiOBHm_Chr4g0389261 [Rosa chinensis]